MPSRVVSGISSGFPELSQSQGQVAHVLLTRSPLIHPRRGFTVRLACVKHAASVRPEPGSNSPLKNIGAAQSAGYRQHGSISDLDLNEILSSIKGIPNLTNRQ